MDLSNVMLNWDDNYDFDSIKIGVDARGYTVIYTHDGVEVFYSQNYGNQDICEAVATSKRPGG